MFARLPLVLASFAALPLLAADAHAGGGGGLSIGFSKHGRHGSLGVQIGFPGRGYDDCAPRPPQYGGHWETVCERVWVPGTCEQVYVQPIYETRRDSCGRPYQVCVRAGYWSTVQHAGHWEERSRQVWRNAGWSPRR